MSLVIGVAGAAVSNNTILLTGIAGLMASNFNGIRRMAISSKVQEKLNQRQIDLKRKN
jgi:broad specificity polyphosphatase/5'/3'-nucleotidase SurE